MKMNRATHWIWTIAVVAAFFTFQHRQVPNLPLPPGARQAGNALQIPVAMHVAPARGVYWNLSRTADGKRYFVNVFQNGNMVRQFPTVQRATSDALGMNYRTEGQIRLNETLYTATSIHINTDGTSGFIVLTASTSGADNPPPASRQRSHRQTE
ncbi:MAG: hypothetical protein IRZ33_02685 [Alicyclobacillaceae bacterium]|nr:hypothetical protein [Alicyclobacillaceae bacterium]